MQNNEPRSYPKTPDGRYTLHAGRLWRCPNPNLPEAVRLRLLADLKTAHRAVKDAYAGRGDMTKARSLVDSLKIGLGERGPVWWTDGAPDHNRELASRTPYRDWAKSVAPTKLPPEPDL